MNKNGNYKLKNNSVFVSQQNLIILLVCSSTLLFLDLSVFSLSFVFGVILIFYTLHTTPKMFKPRGLMKYLFAFLFVAGLSIIFSKLPLGVKHFKILLQTIYWFLIASITFNVYPYLNKQKLSKYILFSVLLLLILYALGLNVGTQNSVAFVVVIISPLSFFYIRKFSIKIIFSFVLIFLMLINGSRTGAIISIIQFGLIFLLSAPKLIKYFKIITVSTLILITFLSNSVVLKTMGNVVYPYNEELGYLMINTEYVLSNDMSWLQRKAQVQKGKQIFAEYPLLGVGYSNFMDYNITIDQSKISHDRGFLRDIDNRSAHNSYVQLLAETGIFGLLTVLLFLITCISIFWKNISLIGNTFESLLLVSCIGMVIYFSIISSFTGTVTWLVFGLLAGGVSYIKKNTYGK